MLIISDKLISDDIIEEHFLCKLDSCKGACCWEGDFGAPLEESEISILEKDMAKISAYLTDTGNEIIEEKGIWEMYSKKDEPFKGTPLHENGSCAFMSTNDLGIAQCGIEAAHRDGKTDLRKPISCHLYPIRVNSSPEMNFEALNYDRWDICSAACSQGKKEKVPLYKFAKEALIRKYGETFYAELEAAAEHMAQDSDSPE